MNGLKPIGLLFLPSFSSSLKLPEATKARTRMWKYRLGETENCSRQRSTTSRRLRHAHSNIVSESDHPSNCRPVRFASSAWNLSSVAWSLVAAASNAKSFDDLNRARASVTSASWRSCGVGARYAWRTASAAAANRCSSLSS
eukprot:Amastigsp_a3561_15.p4 type:complete len:142 gc:universal Amastigsp_a3561_15:241-666(+)